MNKPESLRQFLLSSVPALTDNPDRLLIFIDKGRVCSTAAPSLSFEYRYSLSLIVTDFADHPDSLMIPLLAWLLEHQPERMTVMTPEAFAFEVDILDNSKVDISISLDLSEAVIVKPSGTGVLTAEHVADTAMQGYEPAQTYQLYVNGQAVAQWSSGACDGVALA